MLSPRERDQRDRRDSRGDESEGQGKKRNRNESEESEDIKIFPPPPTSTLTCYKDSRPCPTVSQYQLDAPGRRKIYDTFATPNHPHVLVQWELGDEHTPGGRGCGWNWNPDDASSKPNPFNFVLMVTFIKVFCYSLFPKTHFVFVKMKKRSRIPRKAASHLLGKSHSSQNQNVAIK